MIYIVLKIESFITSIQNLSEILVDPFHPYENIFSLNPIYIYVYPYIYIYIYPYIYIYIYIYKHLLRALGHLDEVLRKNAEEMFKRISEAHEILTDPVRKQLWDEGHDEEAIKESTLSFGKRST